MIVKNEQEVLARCLSSVCPYVDELIVCDTGSTDKTKEIALFYGAKLFDFAWIDDFAAARNFSFSQATKDYILWLDADDVLPDGKKLISLKKRLTKGNYDVVRCPYDLGENRALTFYRERILKKSANFKWRGCVHECIAPRGRVLDDRSLRVLHLGSSKQKKDRNLRVYEGYLAHGNILSPRDIFYYAREQYYNALYDGAIETLQPLYTARGAWYVNLIEGCKIEALCYLALGKTDEAIAALFKSFSFGEPRAAILCELGGIFRKQHRYREAIYWLNSALFCKNHVKEGDFYSPLDRTLRPYLELTCAYYDLGEYDNAVRFHCLAEKRHPDHPSVTQNRAFFISKGLI